MSASAAPVRGSEAVRKALEVAAGDLLAERGPRALSVRDVARRAGVNHGQVHHYFGGKRALLVAAMRRLARDHLARATRAGPVPAPLSVAEDSRYWRAVCHVLMDGDLELARLEVDEGVSVPRRALAHLEARAGATDGDVKFRARFAAATALQLGWAAFEEFMYLIADLEDADRATVRGEVRDVVMSIFDRGRAAEAG